MADPLNGEVTPFGWRPAWSTPATEPASPGWPPPGAPTLHQLDWTQKIITTVLLVIALPWLLLKLVRDPAGLGLGVARKQVG